MIQSPKNLTEQLLNLCERLAVEMRALFNTVDTKLGKTEKATSAKTADTATSSVTATKATQDASGNIITSTYATKAEVTQGLAGKANTEHTHTSADVTDLNVTISNALKPYATTNTVNTELAKKANESHTHAVSDVDGLQVALDGKLDATAKAESAKVADSANSVSWDNVTGKPSISSSPEAYITETWHSGESWYRKWSDGFIEQGGRTQVKRYSDTVTLHTAYTSNQYTVVLSPTHIESNYYSLVVEALRITKTSFDISYTSEYEVKGACSWYTAGY